MPSTEVCVAKRVGPGWETAKGLLREARLARAGVRHGFTTRGFGDMKDPVRRRAALEAAGCSGEGRVLKQVHEDRVLRGVEVKKGSPPKADGWVIARPSDAVCIYTADCVPLFLWDETMTFGGLFHVGWRGAALGFAKTAVHAVCAVSSGGPERLSAALGPHVGPCCYTVAPEVAERFQETSLVVRPDGVRLDLGREVTDQLAEAGVRRSAVTASPSCTHCHADLFFSYRRDHSSQCMMGFLAL